MRKNQLLIMLSVLLILLLAACTPADAPAEPTKPAAEAEVDQDLEAGQDDADTSESDDAAADQDGEAEVVEIDAAALYAERCASCHGANREGGGGPSLLPARLTKDPAAYKTTITNGSGPMPAWGSRLSAEEIDALVEFILSDVQ